MEEPTFTAIDYNSLENRVIEGLVGDYYQMVKNTFETVLYRRIHIQDSPRGLCADLMEANEIAMKIHDIQRMIISRPGFRMNQEMFRQYGNGNCNKG